MNKKLIVGVLILISVIVCYLVYIQFLKVETFSTNFILLGDTGTGKEIQKKVSNSINIFCKDNTCNNMYILGDVIYENGIKSKEDSQIQTKLVDIYKDYPSSVYIMFGNHDYRGCTGCLTEFALSSQADNIYMPERYYTVIPTDSDGKEIPVEFVVLDTEKMDKEQLDWLATVLNSDLDFKKIILGHRPIISNESTHSGEVFDGYKELKALICPLDTFYITGHSHSMEYFERVDGCNFKQVISGGGGADLREEKNNPIGNSEYYKTNGFAVLNVSYTNKGDINSINVEFRDLDGKSILIK